MYVIGGIVDDNQLKGLSLSKAKKFGIAHGKLPIKNHLASFNNQSLNINHSTSSLLSFSLQIGNLTINFPVVEILLSLGQGKGIKEALELAVPQRYVAPKTAWRSKNGQPADKPSEDTEKAEEVEK